MNYHSTDELLVAIVQKHPDLYNKQNDYYRDDEHRRNSWTFIAKSLEMDVETAKKRWDNLRDRFVRAYREYCDNPPSHSDPYVRSSKFRLFEHMLWLAPYIRKRKITSTVAARRKSINTLLNPVIGDVINDNQNNETQDSLNLKTEIQSVTSDTTLHESYDLDEDGMLSSTSSGCKRAAANASFSQNAQAKSDHYFMMSIVQDCQNLPPRKKLKFKRDVLELLEKYLYEDHI